MRETYFAKLHPVIDFGFFIAAICFAVLVQHPAYLAAGIVCGLLLNVSLVGRKAIKSFLWMLPLWAFLTAINPLFNTLGQRVLFTYFGRHYTLEALYYGMAIASMFVAMLQWFSAYNHVMTEDKFSFLFGSLAPSLSLLLVTVLRMIPDLTRKGKQILTARKCIGMGGAEDATAREKVTDGLTALSVLTSWALEGSIVTADSMNSRGYGTEKRSCYHSYRFRASDIGAAAALLFLGLTAAYFLLGGSGWATYTPFLWVTPVAGGNLPGLLAYILFLLTPTILNVKEEIQWFISRSRI